MKNLTRRQIDYYLDTHRFTVNPAGRRSRKTLIAKRKVYNRALRNPNHRYFHGAPTRAQAKAIFWRDLKKWYKPFIVDISETDLMITIANGTEIAVVGLDKPERIEGTPWNGCHITEFGDVKADAWQENIRPVLADTGGFAIFDGVPAGRNHYYDLAVKSAGGALPASVPVDGAYAEDPADTDWAYYHWFSSDVLPKKEVESAKRDMDARTYRQEFEGSFESFEGLVYYAFGSQNFRKISWNRAEQVYIGVDFNIDPMTAVLCHVRQGRHGPELHQFGELYLKHSRTTELIEAINDYFGLSGSPRMIEKIRVFPDSTGKRETSNASRSDIAQLQRAGFRVMARPANPRQKDRVAAVNGMICNLNGHRRYYIDRKCEKTLRDLNRVEQLADGRLNKDQERQGLKHITDALGYLIAYNWPVKRSRPDVIERS